MKIYYSKLIADRRRKRRRILTPRRITSHFVTFHGLDEEFCARTILPRIAFRNERIPLDRQVVLELPREFMDDFDLPRRETMLLSFAEEMEHSLSELLYKSVADFNCGNSAGCRTHSYDLGTKDEPIRINARNVEKACANLATCGNEVPRANLIKSALLLPLSMYAMIRANAMIRFVEPFPILPKHIRFGVEELGELRGSRLFIDETITGESTAYAIRQGAIRWNFKFEHEDCTYHNSLRIVLRYGIFILYPEHVVKMEVAV
jgi:hypothetical protein